MISSRPGHRLAGTVIPLALLVTIAGCGERAAPEPEAPAVQPVTVENSDLRLRLNDIPTDFTVATNDGADLVLEHADPAVGGTIVITARPPEDGQNLPSAVKFHKAFIENQEAGDYQGGRNS